MGRTLHSIGGGSKTPPVTAQALTAWDDPRLSHGFLGRAGGVSEGPFAGLNFSYLTGDDRAAVDTNWRLFRESLEEGSTFVRLHQVHGNAVHMVRAGEQGMVAAADGLVTAVAGTVLCVLSADCVPVLMVDGERPIVGALHAGWRGVLAGIADAGVRAMRALGAAPERIRAALGPGIGACCFEVDQELAERFIREVPGAEPHSTPGAPGKAQLDLKAILYNQLEAAGLPRAAISVVGPCTRCAGDRYYSRRASGGGATGLQLSYVGLNADPKRGVDARA